MGDHRGGHLVVREVELPEKLLRLNVPGGGKPFDAGLAAVTVNFLILGQPEFQTFLLLSRGGAPRAFPRRVQHRFRIDNVNGPLLEFHGMTTRSLGEVNQLPGDFDVAVVVDADLGDDECFHELLVFSKLARAFIKALGNYQMRGAG